MNEQTKNDLNGNADIPAIENVAVPHIDSDELKAAYALELDLPETNLLDSIARENHPKEIKKGYRLKAILWSVVLAAVILTTTFADKQKLKNLLPTLLRFISGNPVETAGVPDQITSIGTQDQESGTDDIFPPSMTPLPLQGESTPPAEETPIPEENLTIEPFNNQIIEDEFKAVEIDGVEVSPNGLEPRDLFFNSVQGPEGYLRIIIKSEGEIPQEGGILSVSDLNWISKGYGDSHVTMIGVDLGDGKYGYDIPIREDKGTALFNIRKNRGDNFVADATIVKFIDPDSHEPVIGQPPAGKYMGIRVYKPATPTETTTTGYRINQKESLAKLVATTREKAMRQSGTFY